MKYYERFYGFGDVFEHYLLAAMADFLANPAGGQLWVALDEEEIIGSIAVVKADEDHSAQLRWFQVDAEYQGQGIGKRLLDTALQFCCGQAYTHVFLWTFRTLDAAHHLYETFGFTQTETKPNTEWCDKPLTEERWDLQLSESSETGDCEKAYSCFFEEMNKVDQPDTQWFSVDEVKEKLDL